MNEYIDGFRRTSVKTKDQTKLREKIEDFEDRGFETMVKKSGGYSYLFVKKKSDSDSSK